MKKLKLEIEKSEQDIAIPLKQISTYYELPISECSFFQNKILVLVKIPVIQKNQHWDLFELVTSPFAWFNQTCTIPHQTLFLAVNNEPTQDKQSLRQISGSGLHQCKPYHDKLCFIPRFSSDNTQGPECARKLYEGCTVQELSQFCPMNCHTSSSLIISEIAEETYIITHPDPTTIIKCGETSSTIPKNYSHQGSIKIKLPCNCKLIAQGKTIIPQRFPCPDVVTLKPMAIHIIPATWSNLQSFILNPKITNNVPTYKNIEECLNTNWSLQIPHLNLTSNENLVRTVIDQIDEISQENTYSDRYGLHSDTIFLVWNIILSILVVYLIQSQNRVIVASNLVAAARADKKGKASSEYVHDVFFYTTCACLILFVIIIAHKLIKYVVNCRKSRRRGNPKSPIKEKERIEMTKMGENKSSTESKTFTLELKENKELRSLSQGETVLAQIECTKVRK